MQVNHIIQICCYKIFGLLREENAKKNGRRKNEQDIRRQQCYRSSYLFEQTSAESISTNGSAGRRLLVVHGAPTARGRVVVTRFTSTEFAQVVFIILVKNQ